MLVGIERCSGYPVIMCAVRLGWLGCGGAYDHVRVGLRFTVAIALFCVVHKVLFRAACGVAVHTT